MLNEHADQNVPQKSMSNATPHPPAIGTTISGDKLVGIVFEPRWEFVIIQTLLLPCIIDVGNGSTSSDSRNAFAVLDTLNHVLQSGRVGCLSTNHF